MTKDEKGRDCAGRKIRNARERQGLSQRGLARRVDCSNQTISNYESGATYPSEVLRERLEATLGITIEDDVDAEVRVALDAYAREHFRQGWARWEIEDLLRGDARKMGVEISRGQTGRIVRETLPVIRL